MVRGARVWGWYLCWADVWGVGAALQGDGAGAEARGLERMRRVQRRRRGARAMGAPRCRAGRSVTERCWTKQQPQRIEVSPPGPVDVTSYGKDFTVAVTDLEMESLPWIVRKGPETSQGPYNRMCTRRRLCEGSGGDWRDAATAREHRSPGAGRGRRNPHPEPWEGAKPSHISVWTQ